MALVYGMAKNALKEMMGNRKRDGHPTIARRRKMTNYVEPAAQNTVGQLNDQEACGQISNREQKDVGSTPTQGQSLVSIEGPLNKESIFTAAVIAIP